MCLALYRIPRNGDQFWQLRLASFIVGISTLVHLATTFLKLKSWWKWLFAAVAPTACIIAWYVYGVQFRNQRPGSIGVYGFLAGGLFWFPIGFAMVNTIMIGINQIGRPNRSADDVG